MTFTNFWHAHFLMDSCKLKCFTTHHFKANWFRKKVMYCLKKISSVLRGSRRVLLITMLSNYVDLATKRMISFLIVGALHIFGLSNDLSTVSEFSWEVAKKAQNVWLINLLAYSRLYILGWVTGAFSMEVRPILWRFSNIAMKVRPILWRFSYVDCR